MNLSMNTMISNDYPLLLIYIIVVNLLGFLLFFIDKIRAKSNKWRISENNLFFISLLGASLGALLAMKLFNHKTKHKLFTIAIPLIVLVQIILIIIYVKSLT